MTEYERLRRRLASTPFVVATLDGEVRLVTEPSAFKLLAMAGPFPKELIMNLAKALEGYARQVGKEDRTFSMREIAAMAGMKKITAYFHYRRGVFTPSVRPFSGPGRGDEYEGKFSWADGFVAGLVGAMWRNRLPEVALAKVQPLLTETTNEQTGQEVATSDRS
jgi:hypothetical protein